MKQMEHLLQFRRDVGLSVLLQALVPPKQISTSPPVAKAKAASSAPAIGKAGSAVGGMVINPHHPSPYSNANALWGGIRLALDVPPNQVHE